MKFKNYCLVIIGDTKGVYPEINKVSEGKANILDGKGMVISTFTSFLDVGEISVYFTYNNRNFLLFELNKENSGFFINKSQIRELLFGFLDNMTEEELDSKSIDFLSVLSEPTTGLTETKTIKKQITETEIKEMSKLEKENLFDEILSKGVKNLTEHDKKMLELLVK